MLGIYTREIYVINFKCRNPQRPLIIVVICRLTVETEKQMASRK